MSDLAERTRYDPSEAEPRIFERWFEAGISPDPAAIGDPATDLKALG